MITRSLREISIAVVRASLEVLAKRCYCMPELQLEGCRKWKTWPNGRNEPCVGFCQTRDLEGEWHLSVYLCRRYQKHKPRTHKALFCAARPLPMTTMFTPEFMGWDKDRGLWWHVSVHTLEHALIHSHMGSLLLLLRENTSGCTSGHSRSQHSACSESMPWK